MSSPALQSTIFGGFETANPSSDKSLILNHVIRCGPTGATSEEVEVALDLRHQNVSARLGELRRAGKIKEIGARRRTSSGRWATVWVA